MGEVTKIALMVIVILASWVWFAVKALHARRRPDDAAAKDIRLALAGLALGMTCQLAADSIDRITGVPNLGRLLGNCSVMVALCAAQLFFLHAAQGDAVRPAALRREVVIMTIAMITCAALFAMTPRQPDSSQGIRNPDVRAIYASPYVYVYIAYFAYVLRTIVPRAWRFARVARRRSLRHGLRFIAAGGCCGLVYCAAKVGLLTAHYAGFGVDDLEYRLGSALYLGTAVLFLLGLTIPVWDKHLDASTHWARRYRSYRRLFPLWHAVYRASPGIALIPDAGTAIKPRRVRNLGFHLYRQVIEIRDGQLALRPYLDPAAGELADRRARSAGITGQERRATVEAATLAVALDAKIADHRSGEPDRQPMTTPPADAADLEMEIRFLERVARLLTTSPVVSATRAAFASPAPATPGPGRRSRAPSPTPANVRTRSGPDQGVGEGDGEVER